jgi:uncharacterized protein
MLKNIILAQKEEYQDLIKAPYVPREQIKFAQKYLEKDIIKVVLGPRRAGKSVFCAHLVKDKDPAYLNFDNEVLIKVKDYDNLIKELLAVYGKSKYLFFDEIQNLDNWELLVNRLQRQGYNIILTGSNAKLLSQELATHLTGRHIPIEILPFNFREFLRAKDVDYNKNNLSDKVRVELLKNLNDYLTIGSFPEIVIKNLEPKDYLSTLIDSIILKDIVRRHKLRLSEKIYNLELYLLNNFSAEFSFRKLARKLDFKSDITVEKYIKYLSASYLSQVLSRYSPKSASRLVSPKKSYLIDNGYINAKALQFSKDQGKLMENLVFTELLKKSYHPEKNLFYYKSRNNKEIDFVLHNNLKIESLIQVTYNINDTETKEREIKALVEASSELRCSNLNIITWDTKETESYKNKKINIITLLDWLLYN